MGLSYRANHLLFEAESRPLTKAEVQELYVLVGQADRWHQIALWLADCLAGVSEHECGKKATTARRRGVLVDLCRDAHQHLVTGFTNKRHRTTEQVLGHLQGVVNHYGEPAHPSDKA